MAQPANEEKTEDIEFEERHIWPKSLLLNQSYAAAFACIKCNGVPTSCMNNGDGEILCTQCANRIDNVSQNKTVRKLINNMKTKCLSLQSDINQQKDDIEGGNIILTQVYDNQCDWTGMIKECNAHYNECHFAFIRCEECKVFKCQRQLMAKHVAECPDASINCPSACGALILRKNAKFHLSKDCIECMMDCTNDDCKMQVKRKDFGKHINKECDARMVECDFAKYGCEITDIKASELKNHMDEYKFDHISNKFDFITTQLHNKIMQQNDIVSEQETLLNNLSSIPRGTITAFNGTVCPKGWAFCDGSNGTPNLAGKFIYGWSNQNNGTAISNNHSKTGGAEAHTLTKDEMPPHNHTLNLNFGPNNKSVSGNAFYPIVTCDSPTKTAWTSETSNSVGNGQSHNNMPPYCVLSYIMKL